MLGRGKFAFVFLALRVPSGEKVALKAYLVEEDKHARREAAILALLRGGPNVQNAIEAVRSPSNNSLCLVTDYYMYDPFPDYAQTMSLRDLRTYMRELLRGLEFVHGKGVIHRDIKPQNVLFSLKSGKLKLIDFGQAAVYEPDVALSPRVGSRFFKAPELLMEYPFYSYAVDIWAAGIIFVSIIFKRFPFFLSTGIEDQLAQVVDWAGTEEYVKFQFMYGRVSENRMAAGKRKSFHDIITPKTAALATEEALDLAAKMLAFDFSARISAKDALQHPFFKRAN